MNRIVVFAALSVLGATAVAACGSATRATLHKDDMGKVFPWPAHQEKVVVRAKPQTTLANTCSWFGSFEEVEVGPDTTFYITDETDQHFAYTPSRSPMRRLSPVKVVEIRWPIKKTEAEAGPPAGGAEGSKEGKEGAGTEQAPEKKPAEEQKGDQKTPDPKAAPPDSKASAGQPPPPSK